MPAPMKEGTPVLYPVPRKSQAGATWTPKPPTSVPYEPDKALVKALENKGEDRSRYPKTKRKEVKK